MAQVFFERDIDPSTFIRANVTKEKANVAKKVTPLCFCVALIAREIFVSTTISRPTSETMLSLTKIPVVYARLCAERFTLLAFSPTRRDKHPWIPGAPFRPPWRAFRSNCRNLYQLVWPSITSPSYSRRSPLHTHDIKAVIFTVSRPNPWHFQRFSWSLAHSVLPSAARRRSSAFTFHPFLRSLFPGTWTPWSCRTNSS